MKSLKLIFALLLFVFFVPTNEAKAQVRRNRTVVVANKANKRQVRRITRRQVRRVHRRNRFRTLRRLPVGTTPIAFRNVNYYPVRGVYYVNRSGAYVRRLPPRGFRVTRLTGRMMRLSLAGRPFVFSEGIFYREVDNQYEVVEAPKGAVVDELPEEVEEIILGDMTAYELYDTLYTETEDGYEVLGQLGDLQGEP